MSAVLDARPVALGFVLPRAFLDERQFQSERRRVETLYSDIELVALPERTFKVSGIESTLLIARSPRPEKGVTRTSLRSSIVAQRDRVEFLRAGKVIVANAVRISRGPWRLASAVDDTGLVASQQLFGCWLREGASHDELVALAAVLNGPVANAFVSIHSPAKGIRITTMRALPLPAQLPLDVTPLVTAYMTLVSPQSFRLEYQAEGEAAALLSEIDALVLRAYDLPPRLERDLLDFFRGADRPTVHPWRHWLPEDFRPALPLHEYLSSTYGKAARSWPLQVFEPLPPEEASALREYLD